MRHEIGDWIQLRPGASTYRGDARVLELLGWGYFVERPDGSRWIWPKEWVR